MPSLPSEPELTEHHRKLAQVPALLPALLAGLPLSFEIVDSRGTTRDGDVVSLGPQGVHTALFGERLLARLSPVIEGWRMNWLYHLVPGHGVACSVVRTPIGETTRRARTWLTGDSTGHEPFDQAFAVDLGSKVSRREWLGPDLARSLMLESDGCRFESASVVNVTAAELATMSASFLVDATPASVGRSFTCALALRRHWFRSPFEV